MVTPLGSKDRLAIPPEHMAQYRSLWCEMETEDETVLNLIKGIFGGRGPAFPTGGQEAERTGLVEIFMKTLELSSSPKYGWCSSTTPYGWPAPSSAAGTPEYILDKRWWSLFTFLPTSVSDTGSFCELHAAHMNTATREAPIDLRTMLDDQYSDMMAKEAVSEEKKWTSAKEQEYQAKTSACLSAFTPTFQEEGDDYPTVNYARYNENNADLKKLCLGAMRMISPPEEAKSETTAYPWLTPEISKAAHPVSEVENYFKGKLRDIPWNDWVRRQDFCVPTTKTEHILTWSKNSVYGVVGVASVLFRRAFQAVLVGISKWAVEIVLTPADAVMKHLAEWVRNIRKGPPPPPPAPLAGGPAPAEPTEDMPKPMAFSPLPAIEPARILVPAAALGMGALILTQIESAAVTMGATASALFGFIMSPTAIDMAKPDRPIDSI